MDSFIDCLDGEKWKEVPAYELEGDFIEYNISRKHEKVDATTYRYALTNDNDDLKPCTIEFCKKDPMMLNNNHINKCEIRLDADGKITGLNLDDMDCVVLK